MNLLNVNNLDLLAKKVEELETENARLRAILDAYGIDYSEPINDEEVATEQSLPKPVKQLSLQEKVELFQSLFRGRDDVFARRWHSNTTQKSGYQPVCLREWNRDYCDKRKYKCSECPNRAFAPLTYNDVYNHLAGKDAFGRDVVGLYPILKDNKCWLLCADFDDKSCEHGYQKDVLAYVAICNEWNVPCYIERSRSGNGAHVWIFFNTTIAATKARRLGNAILTEAMNREKYLSFKSYDRLFPNQDTLPDGGLGNLVALPLQGLARRNNNSVFVDEEFNAYDDQWSVLLNVVRVPESIIDAIVKNYAVPKLGEDHVVDKPSEPNIIETSYAASLPKRITLTRANMVYIPLNELPAKTITAFKRLAAFRNPEFYEKQSMRLPTYNIPRIISCSEIKDDYLVLPRGCEDAVVDSLTQNGVAVKISDKTNHGSHIDVSFKGTLRSEQQDALAAMLEHNIGTLSATTAFGKTVFAISMIAQKKVNTLILVHNKALLEQWKSRIEEFLEINEQVEEPSPKRGRKRAMSPIGCLHSGKNTINGKIDIALIQSCLEDGEAKCFIKDYGMVIVDECHHVSSVSFEQVLRQVTAKYVYGLTATPIRKDGHQPIIFMQCGKIRFAADAQSQMSKQSFKRMLMPRFTTYHNITDDAKSYAQLSQVMSEDKSRNELIISDVKQELTQGRTPLVLTTRTGHVKLLAQMLKPFAQNIVTLIGADSAKDKREALQTLQSIPSNESLVIVATGKYIGEGFDYPRLDTLFLAMPISWKGNIAQYAGRLHRNYPGKAEVRIYDYIDIHIPLCDSMYRKRLKGYAAVGYGKTVEEASPTSPDLIYDKDNYEMAFYEDIKHAQRSVVIAVPKATCRYKPLLMKALSSALHNGVEIALHIKEAGHNESEFASAGISIIVNTEQTMQCAIIDKEISWYGNINYFGYSLDDSTTMRIQSHHIADEMINVLYSKKA